MGSILLQIEQLEGLMNMYSHVIVQLCQGKCVMMLRGGNVEKVNGNVCLKPFFYT